MYGYVYKTTNLVNDKIYIGQHKCENFDNDYIGSGILLHNAINKYGINYFKCEIIEECDSKEELNEREKYWIRYYNSQNKNIGYNIANGGNSIITDEVKKKISKNNAKYWLGKQRNVETNKKISEKLKNRKRTKESILKQMKTRHNRELTEKEIQQRRNVHLGKPMTEEIKLKISLKIKGKKWVNNSLIELQVDVNELDSFIKNGFILGRKTKRRKLK